MSDAHSRRSTSARRSLAVPPLLLLAVLFAPGCGPKHLLESPDSLPKSVGPRQLWNTEHAYIYASRDSVAAEAEAWIDTLARYIGMTLERRLGKGLVIVVDDGEAPIVPSLEAYVALQNALAQSEPRADFKTATIEERRAKLEEACTPEDAAIRLFPSQPDAAILSQLGLPQPLPGDIEWLMSCPSEQYMQSAVAEIAPAVIEKKKGKAYRVLTAGMMPLAVPKLAKAFCLSRDTFAFRLWCMRQTDWSVEQCREAIEAYTRQRAKQISPQLNVKPETAQEQPAQSEGNETDDKH